MQGFDITSVINTIKSFYQDKIQSLYLQLLSYFPAQFQSIVSIIFALLFIYAIIRIIKKDFIFIVLLVILVPTSIPVLQSIWEGIVMLVKFMFTAGH